MPQRLYCRYFQLGSDADGTRPIGIVIDAVPIVTAMSP